VRNPLHAAVLALGRAIRAAAGPRRGADACVTEFVIHDLGRELDGYTIVALADLHHSAGSDLTWLRHAVSTANAVEPDLIVLLGDYGESFKRMPAESARWYRNAMPEMTADLARLRARDGVVAVLGNHDHDAGAGAVIAWLESIDIDVLVNRSRSIVRSQSTLRIAGLDDVREGRIDERAGCNVAEDVPTIVLSHNPDGVFHLDPQLRVDAVLAGHTHGGQIILPGLGALVTMARACGRKSASGWVTNPRAPLYVTRGLGEQLPMPMRIKCPPELLVLRLRTAAQQPA
jgi:predicted MPP superfamily phosphohydrolase